MENINKRKGKKTRLRLSAPRKKRKSWAAADYQRERKRLRLGTDERLELQQRLEFDSLEAERMEAKLQENRSSNEKHGADEMSEVRNENESTQAVTYTVLQPVPPQELPPFSISSFVEDNTSTSMTECCAEEMIELPKKTDFHVTQFARTSENTRKEDIMVELYKKNVWNDAKTVNVISTACFSKFSKVMTAALKFFLGSDEPGKKSDDSDSDNEVTAKDVIMANKVNKKTRKRDKQLKKVKQVVEKKKKKKNAVPVYNFSALHLVHDPQGLAEKLFQQLEKSNDRFEVKLLLMEVVSRLIGLHQLIVLNYYPFLQRFLQPHQREVTKILQCLAQSAHELVPPDVLAPLLKTLVNNFVTERNSSDVMAVGLNAVREMCSRCPLVMNEDLLRDLTQYKKYRERSVMMAAQSLIHLFRVTMPDMLHKKDRGRPTEARIELKQKKYGEVDAKSFIPGAEVLLDANKEREDSVDLNSDDSEDDDEWVDVNHSSDDNCDEEEIETGLFKTEDSAAGDKVEKRVAAEGVDVDDHVEKEQKAALASTLRILSDEDFRKIEAAQLSKEVTSARKAKKRPPPEEKNSRGELVSLQDIENIFKKRRHDKEARLETVKRGQQDRIRYSGYQDRRQNPFASKTNREKRKTKNFMMIRHKVRGKIKRSFKEKQIALRNHLLKLKKMK